MKMPMGISVSTYAIVVPMHTPLFALNHNGIFFPFQIFVSDSITGSVVISIFEYIVQQQQNNFSIVFPQNFFYSKVTVFFLTITHFIFFTLFVS